MKPLVGIVARLPYTQLEFVGVLLFEVYPSTIIYKDENENPVIKEWVDCTDDNKVNRYFYYSVDKRDFKEFISGELSHLNLITRSTDSLYFQDESTEQIVLNTTKVALKTVPNNYLPKSDFIFSDEYGVDTHEIFNSFDLQNIELINSKIPDSVKVIAAQENSETLYIHFQKGKGIGHGVIRTDIFTSALNSIDELYRNIALDYSQTKDRGEIKKGNQRYIEITATELFGIPVAASYGFMLRPITNHLDLFPVTPANNIVQKTMNLITNSKSSDLLKDEFVSHSKFTMIAYKNFLNEVYNKEISVDLNWFNPKKLTEINIDMDYITANRVITEIENLSALSVANIDIKGRFRALNCDTLHFVFVGTGDDLYKGHFDIASSADINNINFLQVYNITIKRTIEKTPGNNEKTINVITKWELDKLQ